MNVPGTRTDLERPRMAQKYTHDLWPHPNRSRQIWTNLDAQRHISQPTAESWRFSSKFLSKPPPQSLDLRQ